MARETKPTELVRDAGNLFRMREAWSRRVWLRNEPKAGRLESSKAAEISRLGFCGFANRGVDLPSDEAEGDEPARRGM